MQSQFVSSKLIWQKPRSCVGCLTRSEDGYVQSRREPTQNAVAQAQHELRTNVPVRQSPDFRLFPLLPEFLDWLPLREQVMDCFNQQYIFLRDDWCGKNQ